MMHDFAVTERHIVFMDLPVVFTPERLADGRFPYAWNDDYPSRLGVLPREGRGSDVRWIEVEPCYVFHPLNAYEEGGRVVVDVCRYPSLWRENDGFESAYLHRFTLDPEAGKVSEERLDDRAVEFPRVDERRSGLRHRYGYAVAGASVDGSPSKLVKYDLTGGGALTHDFGPEQAAGEAVFVPASDRAGEDEGWVLALVYDAARGGSDLVVLDAARFAGAPVARVRLPQRVPFGFHGSWVPDPR
jgi:carotenoid cleavage dioxygenase